MALNQTWNVNCILSAKFPLSAKLVISSKKDVWFIFVLFSTETCWLALIICLTIWTVFGFFCLFSSLTKYKLPQCHVRCLTCPFWSAAGNQCSFLLAEYSTLTIHWLCEHDIFPKSWKIRWFGVCWSILRAEGLMRANVKAHFLRSLKKVSQIFFIYMENTIFSQ